MDFEVSEPALRRWVMASTEPADVPAKRIAELEGSGAKISTAQNSTLFLESLCSYPK
jgi:hypothetical protein